MENLIQSIYVEGNILLTFCNMMILFFAFDCIIGFGSLIKSIKGAVS